MNHDSVQLVDKWTVLQVLFEQFSVLFLNLQNELLLGCPALFLCIVALSFLLLFRFLISLVVSSLFRLWSICSLLRRFRGSSIIAISSWCSLGLRQAFSENALHIGIISDHGRVNWQTRVPGSRIRVVKIECPAGDFVLCSLCICHEVGVELGAIESTNASLCLLFASSLHASQVFLVLLSLPSCLLSSGFCFCTLDSRCNVLIVAKLSQLVFKLLFEPTLSVVCLESHSRVCLCLLDHIYFEARWSYIFQWVLANELC